MEEIMETAGQAFLACFATITIIGICTWLLFNINWHDNPITGENILTVGEYIFLTLDSLLP